MKNNILKTISSVAGVFKEGQKQKKWSAKRSVSGVIVTAAVTDMSINGVRWENVILCFIAVLPLCFSVFNNESSTCKTKRR